jgi:hypothetical protein
MATSSILGGDRVPVQPAGMDVASLGPSDSTDSGSDIRGAFDADELSSDTDAEGTGERSSVDPFNVRSDADILPDHIEGPLSIDMDIEIENAAATNDEEALERLLASQIGADGADGAVAAELGSVGGLAGEDEASRALEDEEDNLE